MTPLSQLIEFCSRKPKISSQSIFVDLKLHSEQFSGTSEYLNQISLENL